MNDTGTVIDQPDDKHLRQMLHIVYACYAAGFLTIISPVIGLGLTYIKRENAEGSPYAGHFRWAIRTFWIGTLLLAVTGIINMILSLTVILAPIGGGLMLIAALWIIYRIAKGWMRLFEQRDITQPHTFF